MAQLLHLEPTGFFQLLRVFSSFSLTFTAPKTLFMSKAHQIRFPASASDKFRTCLLPSESIFIRIWIWMERSTRLLTASDRLRLNLALAAATSVRKSRDRLEMPRTLCYSAHTPCEYRRLSRRGHANYVWSVTVIANQKSTNTRTKVKILECYMCLPKKWSVSKNLITLRITQLITINMWYFCSN